VKELFAGIPYQLHLPREAYYHSLLLLWLNMLGFEVQAEVSTNQGRIDAVWTWKERVVIAEVKYAAKGKVEPLLEAAMTQIREQRYFERYAGEQHRIALLALGFTKKDIACRMAEL
jgi:Holliday junction resolvase-like predicted endonuclease